MKAFCESKKLPLDDCFGGHLKSCIDGDLNIVLYDRAKASDEGSAGAAVLKEIQRLNLQPETRAWDLLSIALSVIVADTYAHRDKSPDGWTRNINLNVAVSDPKFWNAQSDLLSNQLKFLTTDIWNFTFQKGKFQHAPNKPVNRPEQDCVALLSGGLDSLIGAIDLVHGSGKNPYAVSQVSRGDKSTQADFASKIGDGLAHLQLNHNASCPGSNERSQRARSIIFLAYGVLIATALKSYQEDKNVDLFICENGFISINPPLTDNRLGSLSTRTTHPMFINRFQQILNEADLRVNIKNPYQFSTKGEMLTNCVDQNFLCKHAHNSISCGRYARNAYKHCGRCLPCLIRRSAFHMWKKKDQTQYVYDCRSQNYACYDDVRSTIMAITAAKVGDLTTWAGPSLSTALLGDIVQYRNVLERGLGELEAFLRKKKVM